MSDEVLPFPRADYALPVSDVVAQTTSMYPTPENLARAHTGFRQDAGPSHRARRARWFGLRRKNPLADA